MHESRRVGSRFVQLIMKRQQPVYLEITKTRRQRTLVCSFELIKTWQGTAQSVRLTSF